MDFMNLLRMNNDPQRKRRVLFAALSGFIAGTIAALTLSFINTWFFPDLPFHTEWRDVFSAWVLWAVLGGVLAGLAAVSSEGWKSILLSALSMAVTVLTFNLMQSSEGILLNLVSFFGLLLPFIAIMAPLAALFFWLGHRFEQAARLKGWARLKIVLINVMVTLVLGVLPGWYAKMDARTEQGVRIIHGILQDAPETVHKALSKTEGFLEHQDQTYTLSQSTSLYSTVGVDVTAYYDDGYTIRCTVVLYPGSEPSVFPCKSQMP